MLISILGILVMLTAMLPAIAADSYAFIQGSPWHDKMLEAGFLLLLLGFAEILAGKIPQECGHWRRAAAAVGLGAILGVISSAMFREAGLPIGAVAAVLIYCYSKKPNRPPRPISSAFAGVKRKISELFRPNPPAPPRDY